MSRRRRRVRKVRTDRGGGALSSEGKPAAGGASIASRLEARLGRRRDHALGVRENEREGARDGATREKIGIEKAETSVGVKSKDAAK